MRDLCCTTRSVLTGLSGKPKFGGQFELLDDKRLTFLEQQQLPYMVVARLTPWVKRAAQRVEPWTILDDN
jgi:hypothetical protein